MSEEKLLEDKRSDETLGAFLGRIREYHGLSIDQLSESLRISKTNLQAIENSDWKKFPVEAYVRSYLNTICRKFCLDTSVVLDIFVAERNGVKLKVASKTFLPVAEKKNSPLNAVASKGTAQKNVTPVEMKAKAAPVESALVVENKAVETATIVENKTVVVENKQDASAEKKEAVVNVVKKASPVEVKLSNSAGETPAAKPVVIKVEPPKFVVKKEPPVARSEATAAQPSQDAERGSAKNVKESPRASFFEEESPKKKNAAVWVVAILFLLACAFAVILLLDKGIITLKTNEPSESVTTAVVADLAAVPSDAEMPEGAILADTAAEAAAAKASQKKHTLTQAEVDEAVKKSGLPASATIFISSDSKVAAVSAATAPVSDNGRTKLELIGSGQMTSWVGLRYDDEDDEFVKEANLSTPDSKLVYNATDTLYVVIGESRAIAKMILNGVETPLPPVKFGRVARFRVYDGRVLP